MKLGLKTTPFDSADYLETDADMVMYLDACLEDGEPALITHALGAIARARHVASGPRCQSGPREPVQGTVAGRQSGVCHGAEGGAGVGLAFDDGPGKGIFKRWHCTDMIIAKLRCTHASGGGHI